MLITSIEFENKGRVKGADHSSLMQQANIKVGKPALLEVCKKQAFPKDGLVRDGCWTVLDWQLADSGSAAVDPAVRLRGVGFPAPAYGNGKHGHWFILLVCSCIRGFHPVGLSSFEVFWDDFTGEQIQFWGQC